MALVWICQTLSTYSMFPSTIRALMFHNVLGVWPEIEYVRCYIVT